MSDKPFFDQLAPDTMVVACIHVLQSPDEVDAVFHTEDGAITMLCEREHDDDSEGFRAIKAGDITRAFAKTQSLTALPINHVAEIEDGGWDVESLAGDA